MQEKNTENQKNTTKETAPPCVRKRNPILLCLDKSGSMSFHQKAVFEAIHQLFAETKKDNETNVDMEYAFWVKTFNDRVEECTDRAFVSPETAALMFDRDRYQCCGGTGFVELYTDLDQLYSTKGMFAQMKKGDFAPTLIIPSDLEETDARENYEKAREKLHNNPLFAKSKRIVIFTGTSEEKRKAAVELAGGEEYVVTLGSNVRQLLTPVLIGTTMMRANATQMTNMTTTPSETGKKIREKLEDGKRSAQNLTDEELEKELARYLKESS